MKYTLKAYSIWEQGPREKQEDSLFPKFGEANDNDRLFIVCDGMGGHSAGEVASGTVCAALGKSVLSRCQDPEGEFSDEIFIAALSDAYDELDKQDNGAEKKMGTTLTFLKLHDKGATIAHIGDSRVYHVRPGKSPEETKILFQTTDHSLVNDLIRIGELKPEEAKHSNQKNVITRAMQPNMERRHKADIYHTHDIKPGDYFMLCSDGILEQLEDENIKFIFSDKAGDAENKTRMLVQVTEHNHDNHTALIVHITDVIDPVTDAERDEPKYLEAYVDDKQENDSKYHMADGTDDNDNDVKKQTHENNGTGGNMKLIVAVIAVFLIAFIGFKVYNNISNKRKAEQIKEQKIEQEKLKEERLKESERKRGEAELKAERERLEKEKQQLEREKERNEAEKKREEAELKAERERLEKEKQELKSQQEQQEQEQQQLQQEQQQLQQIAPITPQEPSADSVKKNDLNKINAAAQMKKDEKKEDAVNSDQQIINDKTNNK